MGMIVDDKGTKVVENHLSTAHRMIRESVQHDATRVAEDQTEAVSFCYNKYLERFSLYIWHFAYP